MTGNLVLTGDEPRYLFASVSAWTGGNLSMAQASWNDWLDAHHIGAHFEASRGVHSVIHSLLLSPVATVFGLAAARWVQLITVSFVAALYFRSAPPGQRVLFACWVLLYFVSIPLLPYLRLIYPEAWLFLLFSIVVIFSFSNEITTTQKYVFLIALVILPFLHLRTALAAAVFGIFFFYQEWTGRPRDPKRIATMLLIVAIALLLFVWYQIALTGSLTGTAISVYEPSFGIVLDRLAAQTFGYRHGLFFNNPIAMIGLAGLILGAMRKNSFMLVCLISLFAYVLTFIWGVASESYSARFWVFVLPLFIYGSIYWTKEVRSPFKWVVLALLAGATLFNTVLFVLKSNFFLENRSGSIAYEYLYDHITHFFNFNLIAGADVYDGGLTILNPEDNLNVLLVLGCFIIGLVGMGARLTVVRMASAVALIAVLTLAASRSFMSPIPADQYVVNSGIDGLGRSYITFTFKKDAVVHGIRFGHYLDRPSWGTEASAPRQLLVNGRDANGSSIPEQRVPGSPLVKFPRSENLAELHLISYSPDFVKNLNMKTISLF